MHGSTASQMEATNYRSRPESEGKLKSLERDAMAAVSDRRRRVPRENVVYP